MAQSPVPLPPVVPGSPGHVLDGHHHALHEHVSHRRAASASERASALNSIAVTASVEACLTRSAAESQRARTTQQAALAASSEAKEASCTAAYSAAVKDTSLASSELAARTVAYREGQALLQHAEALLGTASAAAVVAARQHAEREAAAVASKERVRTLQAERDACERDAEDALQKCTAAQRHAFGTAADERTAGEVAEDALATAIRTRSRASQAELLANDADKQRAAAASAVAAATAAAREAAAAERSARAAMEVANRDAESCRTVAMKAHAEAEVREREAKQRTSQKLMSQAESIAAVRRATTEDGAAMSCETRFTITDAAARNAALDAAAARSNATSAGVQYTRMQVDVVAARSRKEVAHDSAQRAGRLLEVSEVNFRRATSEEEVARYAQGAAERHASVERRRHEEERMRLADAKRGQVLAHESEVRAQAYSRAAAQDAEAAHATLRSVSAARQAYEASPRRVAYLDTLSPEAHALALADYASPLRNAYLDAASVSKVRAMADHYSPARERLKAMAEAVAVQLA